MKFSIHKICLAFFVLITISFQTYSDPSRDVWKNSTELTAGNLKKATSNNLLCEVSTTPQSIDKNYAYGVVESDSESGVYVCKYSPIVNGNMSSPVVTGKFDWLDMTHGEVGSYVMVNKTQIIKPATGTAYFALRGSESGLRSSNNKPALCIQRTDGLELKFGYEGTKDGQQWCDLTPIGASYRSPFHNEFQLMGSKGKPDLSENNCTGKTFSPKCHDCNGNGCGLFKCSSFTKWDDCPAGSHLCGYQTCVGGLCSQKPLCEYDQKGL